ncbi:hypothetical protein LIER_14639 [Lithospermum erythrorhizon]|uniref:Uncharacterized protein n=1 Tax=Lithospermum erythrorhizon TaxID=34254 RepID=A0AAV3PZV1_LITER
MGVLTESWCFCNGGGKSERMKGTIFSSKNGAIARISSGGTGFLIHRNLLLTTHINLPSVVAAEAAEIRLNNGVAASLSPHRFFITSSVLDLTIVGLDFIDENTQPQPHHFIKTCSKANLDLGSVVYLLGYAEKNELLVGEGKVVIATDNLIKLSTDGVVWSLGSAGFDDHGNLAFMVCDPMKLATSPNVKSSSTSSSSPSSRKKDHPTQFGIPIPIICDWLNQHWEGSLDDLNKPKLPLMRLMSTGQRSDHSCTSFTMRQVFKSMETDNDDTGTSLVTTPKLREQPGPSSTAIAHTPEDRNVAIDAPAPNHIQGIPTPEIYESPKLTSVPLRNKETTQIQLLDINFPPRTVKSSDSPQFAKKISPNSNAKRTPPGQPHREERYNARGPSDLVADADIASTGSVDGVQSEVQSCSSPIRIPHIHDYYSSEGETTMYSAETAESRNYPSPKEGRCQYVGRSQSCVNYNRWGPVHNNPAARRTPSERQRSFNPGRKVYSQGATSQRSNDYFSPTVSSIMKKRNSAEQSKTRVSPEQPTRVRPSTIRSSPKKWMF